MPEESGFMWMWGACPRCGAAAWIDAREDANAAYSKQCGFSIWEYLEPEYAWGASARRRRLRARVRRSRPRATGHAMNRPPRERGLAPLYGSDAKLIPRAGVILLSAERARERELEGEHLAAPSEVELAAGVCASIAPKLRAAACRPRACDTTQTDRADTGCEKGVSRLR